MRMAMIQPMRAALITYTETSAKGRCERPGCEFEVYEMAETVKQPIHHVRSKLQYHMGRAHRLKVHEYFFALEKEVTLNVNGKA